MATFFYHPTFVLAVIFILVNKSFTISSGSGSQPYSVVDSDRILGLDQKPQCILLNSKVCNDLAYNHTMFPNSFGHATQEEADRDIESYKALINVKCSSSLKLFLCVMYFPVCNVLRENLKPCKSLCDENRERCEPVMQRFNFRWSDALRCEQFKDHANNPLCISDNATEDPNSGIRSAGQSPPVFQCPDVLKLPNKVKVNPVRIGGRDVNCGLPCNTTFFPSQEQRRFAHHWVFVWAVVCFVFTFLSVVTFLLDRTRFQYPERPFVYIIMCYCIISAVYIVGFALGDSVSCATNQVNPNASKLLVRGTNQNTACAILFMVSYFFTMASSLWWLILTFTWLLASSLQWAQESISNLSHYFHFLAWALPASMTITLLILGEVEADSLTGICFTGVTNRYMLLGFVIIPSAIFLLLGIIFLLVGFASLIKIRRFVKQQSAGRTEKFEKLIMRIGFLGALYVVPAVVTLAIWTYEAIELLSWLMGWWQRSCAEYNIPCPVEATNVEVAAKAAAAAAAAAALAAAPSRVYSTGSEYSADQAAAAAEAAAAASAIGSSSVITDSQLAAIGASDPRFELIMVKYLMSLIIGVSFSLWVWSNKTMKAWCRLMQCRFERNGASGGGVNGGQGGPPDGPEFRHPMIATSAGIQLQQQQAGQSQLQQQQAGAGRLAYYSNAEQRVNIL